MIQWAEFVDTEKTGGTVDYLNTVNAGGLEKILGITQTKRSQRYTATPSSATQESKAKQNK